MPKELSVFDEFEAKHDEVLAHLKDLAERIDAVQEAQADIENSVNDIGYALRDIEDQAEGINELSEFIDASVSDLYELARGPLKDLARI